MSVKRLDDGLDSDLTFLVYLNIFLYHKNLKSSPLNNILGTFKLKMEDEGIWSFYELELYVIIVSSPISTITNR